MATATVSRWTRRFVGVGVVWFVCWQAAVVVGVSRGVSVTLGLYGFVFHVLFGKAYALVPSYFDRSLAFPRAPAVHLPLAAAGVAGMALGASGIPPWGVVGVLAWTLGVFVFVAAIAWSVRDNLTGRETGTAESKAELRRVDRVANAFIPIAIAYLVVGTVLSVGQTTGAGPSLVAGRAPVTHLLAAGGVALLLFAVGFRVLPRFLVVRSRLWLARVVLVAGAVGPLMLAVSFGGGESFTVGASLEAVALVGFALAYVDLFRRSDRRRIGLYVFCAAAAGAVLVAGFGVFLTVLGFDAAVADAHARIALLGFLGLAIVAVSYQFYPPAVAAVSFVDDRTAAVAAALLVVGLSVEVGGILTGHAGGVAVGRSLALVGSVCYAGVLAAVFVEHG